MVVCFVMSNNTVSLPILLLGPSILFRYLQLIDIKSVRNISYYILC